MSESAAQKAKKAPPERGIAKQILMLRLQSDVLLAIFFVYKNSAASSERTGVTSRCVADGRGFRPTFSPDAT